MPDETPLPAAPPPDPRAQVTALFADAHKHFQQRNRKQAAVSLALAETTARHHQLHREAAQFRQAMIILAQGGTPKLLARPLPKV